MFYVVYTEQGPSLILEKSRALEYASQRHGVIASLEHSKEELERLEQMGIAPYAGRKVSGVEGVSVG
jgi:hypothetical protein